jgi:hypothetical protein
MNKEQLKRIFEFLEEKENKTPKDKGNLIWKLTFNEPLTEKDLDIEGDLDLSETPITSLPEGLKVKGDLNLAYSKITSLPKGLKVGGDLRLDGCANITSLPKGLVVDGDLNVSGTPLEDVYDENQMYDELIEPGFIRGAVIFSWPNPDDEDYEADEEDDDYYHY